MPMYCYSDKDGKRIERVFAMGKAPRILEVDGVTFKRDFRGELTVKSICGNWPMFSDAAGVHPEQIKDAREKSVRDGVPTDFTPDGRAIFTSANHRKKYCRSIGLHDRNGGYSDP